MSSTYTQLYVQVVFAVKGRENFLQKEWRQLVFKYISGIITAKGQKAIIVNGVADHVHCFIGFKPTICLADLVRDIKANSSKFINESKFMNWRFEWQPGYGGFTYAHSQLDTVYKYVLNQETHNLKKTFREEYLDFLDKFEIDHSEDRLFEWYD